MKNRVLGLLLLVLAGPSHALPILDGNASTLQEDQWQVGLWDSHYGINDSVTLSIASTISIVSTLSSFDVSNFFLKGEVFRDQAFKVSAAGGVLHYRAPKSDGQNSPFIATYFPLELTGSYDFWPFVLSGRFAMSKVITRGDVPETDETTSNSEEVSRSDLRGALNLETGVFSPSLYWDWGDGFAWVFDMTFLLYQKAKVQADAVVLVNLGDRASGRAVLQGDAQADLSAQKTRNFSVYALWYWSNFHLKLGATMGHLMLPYLNIFPVDENGRPFNQMFPKVDFYWRF